MRGNSKVYKGEDRLQKPTLAYRSEMRIYVALVIVLLVLGFLVGWLNPADIKNQIAPMMKELVRSVDSGGSLSWVQEFWRIFLHNAATATELSIFGLVFGIFPAYSMWIKRTVKRLRGVTRRLRAGCARVEDHCLWVIATWRNRIGGHCVGCSFRHCQRHGGYPRDCARVSAAPRNCGQSRGFCCECPKSKASTFVRTAAHGV